MSIIRPCWRAPGCGASLLGLGRYARLVAVGIACVVLVACSPSPSPSPSPDPGPKDTSGPEPSVRSVLPVADEDIPLYAINDGGNKTEFVAGSKRHAFEGSFVVWLPKGRALLSVPDSEGDGYVAEVVNWRTGDVVKTHRSDETFVGMPTGTGPDELLIVRVKGNGEEFLDVFTHDLDLKRSIRLGKHVPVDVAAQEDKRTRFFRDPVSSGDSTFVAYVDTVPHDGFTVGRDPDGLLRITEAGDVREIYQNEHMSDLTRSTDGKSLLAVRYGTNAENRSMRDLNDVVQLDGTTGNIIQEHKLPTRLTDPDPCEIRLDGGGDLTWLVDVAICPGAPLFHGQETTQSEAAELIRTTWRFLGNDWATVGDSAEEYVAWQSRDARLEWSSYHADPRSAAWFRGTKRQDIKVKEFDLFEAPGYILAP